MAEVGTTAPVVADAHVQHGAVFEDLDVGGRGVGVLGGVGQGLGDGQRPAAISTSSGSRPVSFMSR